MNTIDPKAIAAHIDSMDALCEKGRKQVKELVGKLFGVELVEEKLKPSFMVGQVWEYEGSLRLITIHRGELIALNPNGHGFCSDPEYMRQEYTYLAPDLRTYLANGGKL